MGRKVHPFGFRLGVIRDWQAKWYADKQYADFLNEDLKLRTAIRTKYTEAGISLVQIERQATDVSITIHTARPGIVIGRGGQRVDEIRLYLEKLIGKRVRLNIQEIRQAELDAFLVARSVADQMEHRVAYRRAMKQAIFRTLQAGAKGMRIACGGRLAGAEIARREIMHQGRVPLNTLRADIDFGFTEAHTVMGRIGVKVWIYKGEVLPEAKEEVETEEKPAEATGTAPIEPVVAAAVTKAEASEVTEAPKAALSVEEKPVVSPEAEPPKAAVTHEKKPARAHKAAAATEEKPAANAEAEPPKAAVTHEKKPARAHKAAATVEEKPAASTEAEPVKSATTTEAKQAKPRVRRTKATENKATAAGTDTEKPVTEKEEKDATT